MSTPLAQNSIVFPEWHLLDEKIVIQILIFSKLTKFLQTLIFQQKWQITPAGTRQTEGINWVWFVERKSVK
jgi:hypothetical protein